MLVPMHEPQRRPTRNGTKSAAIRARRPLESRLQPALNLRRETYDGIESVFEVGFAGSQL
jgi:hypothetical protein